MSVPANEVEQIARLASLAVDRETLATLTKQVGDILRYVAQLDAVSPGGGGDARSFRPGPEHAPLRQDHVGGFPMMLEPRQMAPDFVQGLYVVPRVSGLGEDK